MKTANSTRSICTAGRPGELYIDKAEIRSLATNENLEDFWCDDPVPNEAAAELGFEL